MHDPIFFSSCLFFLFLFALMFIKFEFLKQIAPP